MKTLILLVLISISSVHAQTDLELVKSFGNALESTPFIATGTVSGKYTALNRIWNQQGGAKEKVRDYITTTPFSDKVIYNASKFLSSFLIEAYDTNNTQWIREIAQLYIPLLDPTKLVEKDSIIFDYPAFYAKDKAGKSYSLSEKFVNLKGFKNEEKTIPLTTDRKFKLWLNADGRENTISSSQFLYAISVIIHYAIKNKLENDKVLRPFIDKFYDVAMNHHYLRWILKRGIPIGSFQAKAWRCNSGNFSHKEHVENLDNKRYGTPFYKDIGEGTHEDRGYCNAYQDRDGYIAMGLAHLMAAHKINPRKIQIDDKTFEELHEYLEAALRLFENRITMDGNSMLFDVGGYKNFSNLVYSGVTDENYPGRTTVKKADLEDIVKNGKVETVQQQWESLIKRYSGRAIPSPDDSSMLIKELPLTFKQVDLADIYKDGKVVKTIQVQWNELKKKLSEKYSGRITVKKVKVKDEVKEIVSINDFPLPKAPLVSWDVSHAFRFVNYFWSFEKTIEPLKLEFDYKYYRKAYANNLFQNTLKKTDAGLYYFANYLCGHDGWYRVNYECKAPCTEGNLAGNMPGRFIGNNGTPKGTPSLTKTVIAWGQAYFIKFNDQLYTPMMKIYDRHIKPIKIDGKQSAQTVAEVLNATASLPEKAFPSQEIKSTSTSKSSESF